MANITWLGVDYTNVGGVYLPTTGGGETLFHESGGSSSWTKVAETTYTISTTSTSNVYPGDFETGDTSIFTSSKIVYVRIRDTAGKRAGYFFGSDSFYVSPNAANGDTGGMGDIAKFITKYTSDSTYYVTPRYGTTTYGVCSTYIRTDGSITIVARYSSTYSGTIDGTYKVEVYTLDYPDGVSPFT